MLNYKMDVYASGGEIVEGIYGAVAKFYDSVNSDINYADWADFAERMIESYSDVEVKLILDAACGTGSMTLELASRGYDMTGVDLSGDMLSVARERAAEAGRSSDILFLCQDLSELELYGTVDACVCTLDSINHITDGEALASFFDLLHRCYLMPGGLLIFDINTPYKFENFYKDSDFILEQDGTYIGWQNFIDEDERVHCFSLSLFERLPDGRYERTDVEQYERIWEMDEIKDMLAASGFETVRVCADLSGGEATDECERWFFVAKNKKH